MTTEATESERIFYPFQGRIVRRLISNMNLTGSHYPHLKKHVNTSFNNCVGFVGPAKYLTISKWESPGSDNISSISSKTNFCMIINAKVAETANIMTDFHH